MQIFRLHAYLQLNGDVRVCGKNLHKHVWRASRRLRRHFVRKQQNKHVLPLPVYEIICKVVFTVLYFMHLKNLLSKKRKKQNFLITCLLIEH